MSGKYFIDTNIIVYAHDSDNPMKKTRAQELIFNGMRGNIVVISAQVLSEFFITVTKKIKQKYTLPEARHELMLLSFLEVVEIDYDLIIRAVSMQELFQINYWDALILAAAERADCDTLFSEDLSHGQKYAEIQCINPFLNDTNLYRINKDFQ